VSETADEEHEVILVLRAEAHEIQFAICRSDNLTVERRTSVNEVATDLVRLFLARNSDKTVVLVV